MTKINSNLGISCINTQICRGLNHSVFELVKIHIQIAIQIKLKIINLKMKIFLFALFIVFVSAHEDHQPPGLFEYTNCCQIEISTATTQYVDSMSTLSDECKAELGKFINFDSTFFKIVLMNIHINL